MAHRSGSRILYFAGSIIATVERPLFLLPGTLPEDPPGVTPKLLFEIEGLPQGFSSHPAAHSLHESSPAD